MKIHLYNYSLPIVFSYFEEVLKKMNYTVQHSDFRNGIISAGKGEGISSLSSLLDLKFFNEKFSVGILIISSSLSNIFGTIFYDPSGEQQFIENLFTKLEAREIMNPLRLPEENYIEAIAS